MRKLCVSVPWNTLAIADRIESMAKISFNAQALGIARYQQCTDVSHTITSRAKQPVMVFCPGIEAIIEGLRLAHVEGFKATGNQLPTKT